MKNLDGVVKYLSNKIDKILEASGVRKVYSLPKNEQFVISRIDIIRNMAQRDAYGEHMEHFVEYLQGNTDPENHAPGSVMHELSAEILAYIGE